MCSTYTVREVTSQPVISVSVTATPQHTVTFVSNGSIYSISTVEENMKVSQPVAPERNGYTFGGWYKDISCTNPYDFQSEVTGDIRLYAKWTAGTYAVEYSKNTSDDVSVPPGQTKKYDNVLILSSQVPERIGYTFKEWNTSGRHGNKLQRRQ
ncbi:MAG: InlB B-repeat-containing protein [Clostridiales bacterium]|nr:MAG: InlB B-repeat-containing protein [Clostridiales bacterium]